MADINKIKINGTEYNISPEWASTGTNTIAIGTSSTTGVKLGTVASFADSSSTIKSDYIQLQDTGSTYPVLTLGSDTNSVSINGGLIVRGGDVELSGGTITAGYVVGDSATINNGFEVKGDTTIGGTLGVTGLTTLGTVNTKGITASGNTTISGNTSISGDTTIGGNLNVTGVSTLGTITMGSGAKISNNLNISGGLSVASSSTFSSTINAKSGIYCTGDATVNGNISLGSSSENIISSSNKLTLRGSGGIEIGNNYGIINSSEYNGIQLGTTSARGLVLGSKNNVTLGNTSSITVIDGDSITLGDYIKLSSGYINTYNVPLEGSSASFSNDVNISGTLNAKGVLNVTSAATFSNTATVLGALKANSTFTSTGAATFNSTVTANGAVTANKGLTAKTSFASPNISDDGTDVSIYGGKVRIGGDSPNIQRTSDSNGYYMSMGTVDRDNPTNYNIAMGVYTTANHQIGTTMMKAGNYRVVCDSNNGVYIGTYNSSTWNNILSVSGGSLAIGNSSYGSTNIYGSFTVNNGLTANTLSVGGAASLNGGATVSGALKANSTFTSTGAATFNSTVTANGAVTANKGLTAKTSFSSPKISDDGSTVTISATTIDVNNGVNGSFDIEGGLTIGSKLNVNGVIEYNPGSGYIVIGSGSANTGSTCPVYIGTTTNSVSIGKGYANITANSNAGTINIGNNAININNGSSVQIKGGDITIGTNYPIVVGDSQILIGTDNGTRTFINLNFTGDGSIKLGTGSNTVSVGRCGNGGEDTLIVKDTVTANGAVTAKSTLSVAGTSTFTGAMTANGVVTANKGLTAKTSFSSPNISDSSDKLYIGGGSPGIHWYNSGSGYYMSMGTVDWSDPSQYRGVVMGVYSNNNPGEFGTNLGNATTKAGPYRIICDSNDGISIGTYSSTYGWKDAISIKENTLNIGGDWNEFSIISQNKATFNNDITLGSGACLYANNSATVKGTLYVYNNEITLGSRGISATKGISATNISASDSLTVSGRISANSGISVTGSISSTSGDISMGSGNLTITKGDVTMGRGTVTVDISGNVNIGSGCLDVSSYSTFNSTIYAKSDIYCTGNASIVGNITIGSSSGGGHIGAANTQLTLSGDKGVTIGDNCGYIQSTSSGVTIGTTKYSGNLICKENSTTLGYKIGSDTVTSSTTIDGDSIFIGYTGGETINIGTIDATNYTAIFGTVSICENGGNLTIGTTGYNTYIRGNLNLSSATIVDSVTLGTTTVNYPLTANDALNANGTLNVSSAATFNYGVVANGVLNAKKTLTVYGGATFLKTASVSGILTASSNLNVAGTSKFTGAVTANGGLTAKTSFTSPHISDTSTAITINGITITNNLTANTVTLKNANGYSITLPLTSTSTTSSASSSSTGSGT